MLRLLAAKSRVSALDEDIKMESNAVPSAAPVSSTLVEIPVADTQSRDHEARSLLGLCHFVTDMS